MKDDKNDDKWLKIELIGGSIALLILGAGIGCAIGINHEKVNNDFIMKNILREAKDKGSSELFWYNDDGTKQMQFIINYVGESLIDI